MHVPPPVAEPSHEPTQETPPPSFQPAPAISSEGSRTAAQSAPPDPMSFQPPPSAQPPFGQPPRPAEAAAPEPERTSDFGEPRDKDHPLVLRLPVGTRLADAERKLILLTLEAVRGNKQRAARVLGISRRGLYSKLQAYGEHVTAAEAQEQAEANEGVEEAGSMSEETPVESEAQTFPPEA